MRRCQRPLGRFKRAGFRTQFTCCTGTKVQTLTQKALQYEAVPEAFGPIPEGWLSYPLAGKHMSFDGRLLHGAPHELGEVLTLLNLLALLIYLLYWYNSTKLPILTQKT